MGSASSTPAVYERPARAVTVFLTVVTTVAIVARILARYLSKAPLGADDVVAYLAYITNLGQLICVFMLIDAGTMSMPRLISMTLEDRSRLVKIYLADGILYTFAIATVKVSLLFLMQRIFTLNRRIFRYLWYSIFIFMIMWTGAVFGLVGWQQVNTQLGNNVVGRIATPIMGGFNALTDALILVLPLWSIKGLNLPSKRKFGLAAIFAIGLCATMVSIARVVFMTLPGAESWNSAYESYTDIILSVVESSTCLICASLIVSRAFWIKLNEVASSSMHDLTNLLATRGSGSRKGSESLSSSSEAPIDLAPRHDPNSISRIDELDIEIGPRKPSESDFSRQYPWEGGRH